MGGLLLIYAVLFAVLAVGLWSGGMFLQAYFYEQPASQMYWRGPAAALGVMLFYVFWTYLDYRSPGSYNTLFEFSASKDEDYRQLWAVRKGQEILYEGHGTPQGRVEFRDARTGKPFSRSDPEGIVEAIIVEDKDKERIRFDAELTSDGKFKAKQGEQARYVEVSGQKRVMHEGTLGKVTTSSRGMVFANLFLNLIHLVVWFLVLWFILRFQLGHAVLISLVLWLVLTLVLPYAFKNVETAAVKAQRLQATIIPPKWTPEGA